MLRMFWRDGRTKAKALQLVLLMGILFFLSSPLFVEIASAETPEAETLLTQLEDAVKSNDCVQANQLSSQIVQTWPGTSHAMNALAGVITCQIAQEYLTTEYGLSDYAPVADFMKIVPAKTG